MCVWLVYLLILLCATATVLVYLLMLLISLIVAGSGQDSDKLIPLLRLRLFIPCGTPCHLSASSKLLSCLKAALSLAVVYVSDG